MKIGKSSLAQESRRLEIILKQFKFVDGEGKELLNKERNSYFNSNLIKIHTHYQSIRQAYKIYISWLKKMYVDVLSSNDKKIYIDKYGLFKQDYK